MWPVRPSHTLWSEQFKGNEKPAENIFELFEQALYLKNMSKARATGKCVTATGDLY